MEITFLGVVFAVIIVLLAIGRPLYQAIAGGMIVTAGLFHIPVTVIVTKIASVIINWSSLSVLLSLYLITFLQRILESRSQIRLAQQDLNGIFHNRRINTAGAAFFIGLLPSAASMILCADIVKDATEGYLDPKSRLLQPAGSGTYRKVCCLLIQQYFLCQIFLEWRYQSSFYI